MHVYRCIHLAKEAVLEPVCVVFPLALGLPRPVVHWWCVFACMQTCCLRSIGRDLCWAEACDALKSWSAAGLSSICAQEYLPLDTLALPIGVVQQKAHSPHVQGVGTQRHVRSHRI
uniref:Uncharacterized protein n=1 Tax=Eutreptiella gymnastica TaxID=73025 RepID=A0A7S4D008_9EUGL|mmetsp:Transcript_85302/g.142132  ORF Transcript_85302/g.142132 Transcript_85302/m.142132 type:complete len:116 (+) Transcript_85302:35-382(+)